MSRQFGEYVLTCESESASRDTITLLHWLDEELPILNGKNIIQSYHNDKNCIHKKISTLSQISNFNNIINQLPLDAVFCLQCSKQLFIISNYGKLFENAIVDKHNKNDNIEIKYFIILNCFIQILSYPQIQHFMIRKKKLFLRLVKK
eukprot:366419_1